MRRPCLLLLVALLAGVAPAAPAPAMSVKALQYLEDPDTHALLHAAPARDPESDRNSRRDECSARLDLTGAGQLLARRVGREIQNAGIRIDEVLSSPRCNAVLTARLLGLEPGRPADFLAPEPPDGSTADDQRDEVLVHLAELRPGETALLVTHGRNIAALTGVETVPGQLLIVGVDRLGAVTVRYSIEP